MRHQHGGHGLTLVELLVVIAITALLLSIFIPVLGRARGQGKLLVCKTRLRSIYINAMVYASDHDEILPYDKSMLGPSHESSVIKNAWIDNPHTALMNDLDIENQETYYCPAQKDSRYSYSEKNFMAGEIGYFYFSVEKQPISNGSLPTFLYNPLIGDPMKYPRRLLSTMSAKTWVASDMWFSGKKGSVPVAHRWYGRGVNYVVLDGSVQMAKDSLRTKFK